MAVISSPTIPSPSPQIQLALKWLDAMSDLNFEAVGSILVDDYVHIVLPATLQTRPFRGKQDMLSVFRAIMPRVGKVEVC